MKRCENRLGQLRLHRLSSVGRYVKGSAEERLDAVAPGASMMRGRTAVISASSHAPPMTGHHASGGVLAVACQA